MDGRIILTAICFLKLRFKRPSIKDIASILNVSVTTISFVLNGKGPEIRISEEITQKILDYAEDI